MSMPVSPGGSRGGPMLEDAAQQTIAAARQQQRYVRPPEWAYEPDPLSADEKAEAEKAKDPLCHFCAGVHPLPSTPACPRLASFELDGEGRVKAGTYRTDAKWQSRVVLAEDLAEEGDPDGE